MNEKAPKVYDIVRELLTQQPVCRNSDKKLIWKFWERENLIKVNGFANVYFITETSFTLTTPAETITRARRKVQEDHPELQATVQSVINQRRQKEETKGMFVYNERSKRSNLWDKIFGGK